MPTLRGLAGWLRARLPQPLKRLLRPLIALYRAREIRRLTRAPGSLSGARRRYAATPRHVVFVSQFPRGREAKIAHGLRRAGWTVTLLYTSEPNYDLRRYFDACIRFVAPEDAVARGADLTPVAYHLFALAGDLACTHVINAKIGPLIFDTTDMLEAAYQGNRAKLEQVWPLIRMQRHALRYADAYCARDLQFKYAKKLLNYARGGRSIFFPEYCWGVAKLLNERGAESRDSRTIRCVLAGNFGIEKMGEGDWGYLRIAEQFIAAKVALHLYPNWFHFASSEEEFSGLFAEHLSLARSSEYFKLYRPMPADALATGLSRYDFGINITWSEVAGEPATSFNPALMPYVMSARVFDYLDAGLPVVMSRSHRLVHALLRRYKVGIEADAAFMADIAGNLRPMANIEARKRAVAASHALAIERHIERLTRFYRQVAADAGITVSA
jgi:hypothetical protein